MCHERWRRREERMEREERRGERLWDLFERETKEPAPPTPVAEHEPDREETLSGAGRPPND